MKQYLDIAKDILGNGYKKGPARKNMPPTVGLHGVMLKHNLQDGFPLLTTKRMHLKGIFYELIWFLGGQTNIKYLVDRNVKIWNDDAYKWYLGFVKKTDLKGYSDYAKNNKPFEQEEFIQRIKDGELGERKDYKLGYMGKIYGYQWRNNEGIDQLANVINGIKNNPNSRYHIINAWNPKDLHSMGLPPCHLLYQFCVRGKHLDLIMYQRSGDFPLGVPYNIASMSLFVHIMAKLLNYEPGEITWMGGDIHIYENQIDGMLEQINREPKKLPKLAVLRKLNTIRDITTLQFHDIRLFDYEPEPPINFPLSVGLKK